MKDYINKIKYQKIMAKLNSSRNKVFIIKFRFETCKIKTKYTFKWSSTELNVYNKNAKNC